jgi:hypothetical protein
MNNSNRLLCPSCDNHYPLDYRQCPVCQDNLIVPTQKNGKVKYTVKDVEGNSGVIIAGPGTVVQPSNEETAEYQFKPTRKPKVTSLGVIKPAFGWIALWGIMMGFLNFSGSVASILSIFSFHISPTYSSSLLNSFFFLLASAQKEITANFWLCISLDAMGLYLLYRASIWLQKIWQISHGAVVHGGDRTFYAKIGNVIYRGFLESKCPSKTCSGTVRVKATYPNNEGYKLLGFCDKQPTDDVYTFDDKTLKGRKTKITRKQKPVRNNPPSSYQH